MMLCWCRPRGGLDMPAYCSIKLKLRGIVADCQGFFDMVAAGAKMSSWT